MAAQDSDVSKLSAVLRLTERYGLSTVLVLVLLWFFLTTLQAELKANREMLEKHVATTVYGNYLQYVTCVKLSVMTGTAREECSIPDKLR